MARVRPFTKAQQAEMLSAATHASRTGIALGDALARWETHLRSSDRIGSAQTIRAYLYGTAKLVSHVSADAQLETITTEAIESLMASLKAGGMSPGARAVVYRPIRTFFRWAVDRDLVSRSPVEKVAPPRVPLRPVPYVTDEQWAAILRTTETRSRWAFRARRDRAILLVFASTGARVAEVASLRVDDLDFAGKRAMIQHGKGGDARPVPLLPEAIEALRVYLTVERPTRAHSSASRALWLAPRGPLTANGIAQMVAERGKAAGLPRRVHPHELRHRFAASCLRGMSGPLVQSILGQKTPSLLNRYGAATRSEDAMAAYLQMAAKRAIA